MPPSSRCKISFFVYNLSDNPIVRAAPFVQAVSGKYDVEVLGFLMDGTEVHRPYQDLCTFKTLRASAEATDLFPKIPQLASMATGDIIYAFKPLMPSFAPALYAAWICKRRPLFLDIEDDDWQAAGDNWLEFIWKDLLKGWRLGTSWKYTAMLQAFTTWVNGKTVISRKLQRRYGGTILRNGPNEDLFDPSRFEGKTSALRKKWNLPESKNLALFAGMPGKHKGRDVLCSALSKPECKEWDLVIAGPAEDVIIRDIKNKLKERCHVLGYQPYDDIPELLAVADAVPIPQKSVSYAESQVPTKLLDAMAMAKPVVASRVGDLPDILGDGSRGWVIEPESPEALAAALAKVISDPKGARQRGRAGRDWFLHNASSSAILSTLDDMFTNTARGGKTPPSLWNTSP